jgi:hypothetical protein
LIDIVPPLAEMSLFFIVLAETKTVYNVRESGEKRVRTKRGRGSGFSRWSRGAS